MIDPSQVRVSGPLERFASGFTAQLKEQGYIPQVQCLQLKLMAHLSCWLGSEGLDSAALSPTTVQRFLAVRRAAGYTTHLSEKALHPLLCHLGEV